METGLQASVRLEGAMPVIELHGEINKEAEPALNAAYAEAASNKPAVVLLNFAGVSYINSTGIALIVAVMADARKEGRRITACGLQDHYLEIFEITRLADFMKIFPDEKSAIEGASVKQA